MPPCFFGYVLSMSVLKPLVISIFELKETSDFPLQAS